MAATYKLMIFMKRRPGMTTAAFRDYYEHRHVPLCMGYMAGPVRYVRNFIDAAIDPNTGEPAALPYDVITELWFEDRAIFDAVVRAMTRDRMPADVIADEMNFIDRGATRFCTIVEHETDLTIAT